MYRESKEYVKAINDYKTAIDLCTKAKPDPETKKIAPKFDLDLRLLTVRKHCAATNSVNPLWHSMSLTRQLIVSHMIQRTITANKHISAKLNKKADVKAECQDIFVQKSR